MPRKTVKIHKRNIGRRRPIKRRRRLKIGKPNPKGMVASIYQFKRQMTSVISLNNVSTPAGWTADGNAIFKQFVYTLDQLPNYTEFTALFASYKICAVKMEIFFSNTNSVDSNSQILCYYDSNPQGEAVALTEQHYMQSQTSRKRVLASTSRRPVKFYTKCKQLSVLYHQLQPTPLTDYGMVWPKYISTSEPTTPHYGFNVRLQRIDDRGFGTDLNHFQYAKINTTVYITCKRVQ